MAPLAFQEKGKSGLITRLLPNPHYLQLCLSPWIHAVHPRFSESKSRFGREEGLPGVAQPHCQSGGGGHGKSCPESEGP